MMYWLLLQVVPTDSAWEIAIRQVPHLAVLCFLTYWFLKHLEKRDKLTTDTMREIESAHESTLNRCIAALDRNTEMFGRVTAVIDPSCNKERRDGSV